MGGEVVVGEVHVAATAQRCLLPDILDDRLVASEPRRPSINLDDGAERAVVRATARRGDQHAGRKEALKPTAMVLGVSVDQRLIGNEVDVLEQRPVGVVDDRPIPSIRDPEHVLDVAVAVEDLVGEIDHRTLALAADDVVAVVERFRRHIGDVIAAHDDRHTDLGANAIGQRVALLDFGRVDGDANQIGVGDAIPVPGTNRFDVNLDVVSALRERRSDDGKRQARIRERRINVGPLGFCLDEGDLLASHVRSPWKCVDTDGEPSRGIVCQMGRNRGICYTGVRGIRGRTSSSARASASR